MLKALYVKCSAKIEKREYRDKATGAVVSFFNQPAVLVTPIGSDDEDFERLPFSIRHENESDAYPAGLYALAGKCFTAGQYGIEFDRRAMRLVPVAGASADFAALAPKPAPAAQK